MKLTEDQIEAILEELHCEVRFYNWKGEAANREYEEKMRKVLTAKFGKSKD